MKVIFESGNANISYDRINDSIIAILKDDFQNAPLERLFQKIEYSFSRYNAKFLISDCSLMTDISIECWTKFIKYLIKNGVKKIALIGDISEEALNLKEIEALSMSQTKCFPCLMTAQSWISDKEQVV